MAADNTLQKIADNLLAQFDKILLDNSTDFSSCDQILNTAPSEHKGGLESLYCDLLLDALISGYYRYSEMDTKQLIVDPLYAKFKKMVCELDKSDPCNLLYYAIIDLVSGKKENVLQYLSAYDNALTLASFAVMLEDGDSIRPLFKRFHTVFAGDKLLSGMQTYIETGIATWNGDYRFPSPYAGLDAVISASGNVAKEKALLTYLDGWYAQCNDLAWYNTVNSSSDVYFGYWSFESAAVAKIFDLNGRVLSQNPYFPVI